MVPENLLDLARCLSALTHSAARPFSAISDDEWRQPYAPGKWKRLEVMGHLIDSAAHNHQRFARALHDPSLTAPGYDSGAQVSVQHYAEAPVEIVLETWRAYNLLIAFVISQMPAGKQQTPCSIGRFAPMTLRDLAFDYVAHLEHHLKQVFAGHDNPDYSGLPWPPAGRWQ